MSKTDKTRPPDVQMVDVLAEVHDHSLGGCDLPTVDDWLHMSNRARYARGSCTYQPRNWGIFRAFDRYKGEGLEIQRVRNRKIVAAAQEIHDQLNDEYARIREELDELEWFIAEMGEDY